MRDFNLKEYLANNPLLNEEEMGSYRKFLEVVKSYEDEDILTDFLNTYPKGEDISKSEYEKFTEKHLGLPDPEDWRGENWKYIKKKKERSLNEDRFEKIEHVFSGEEEDLRHDGTSWEEFDNKRDDLMTQAEVGIDELLTLLHDQAYELGGDTNGPGIWYDIKDLLRDKL